MALPNAPQSRNEKYLAKIAGQEVELPNEPLSREEQYLEYIATHGGGGVVANPEGQTTEKLTALEVDGTKYAVGGGGSALEAGNYIEIDANDKINVKMEKGDTTEYEYRLTGEYSPTIQLTIEKYRDGELISTESYINDDSYTPIDIDGLIEIWYSAGDPRYYWHYKLLEDSREHSTNYEDSWYYTDTTTRTEIFDVEDSSLTLVRNCDLAPVAKSGSYSDLNGNPSINGVELSGNKTASDLGLVAAPVVILNNGMVSHSTDTSYITVDLDTPLTALKQYSVTLKDPSSNYIETLKVLWNGAIDLTFPGNASTSGGFGLRLLEETVQLFNYGGMWRDIYCTIEEAAEDEHELKTLRLSSGTTNGNGVRGTGLNIEDVVIVGVSSGDSSSDLMWNLGMKNVSGGKHEYTIRFFRPSGELCSNMNFWADVFYYDI